MLTGADPIVKRHYPTSIAGFSHGTPASLRSGGSNYALLQTGSNRLLAPTITFGPVERTAASSFTIYMEASSNGTWSLSAKVRKQDVTVDVTGPTTIEIPLGTIAKNVNLNNLSIELSCRNLMPNAGVNRLFVHSVILEEIVEKRSDKRQRR